MWTFAISGAFLLVGVLLLTTGGGFGFGPTGSGAFYGALLATVVNLVEARGLSNGRDWARYAMTPMLWIFVGAGVLLFLVSLGQNSFNIPIGGILAVWALNARPNEALGAVPAASAEGTYLILGAIIPAVFQFF